MNKQKQKATDRLNQFIDNYWMGLGDISDLDIVNPLLDPNKPQWMADDPVLEYLHWMKQPEYFGFTCNHLFNIELLPFQIAILRELWIRKFPMLIATRGAGKSFLLGVYAALRAFFHQGASIVLAGAGFRQSRIIFEYVENLWRHSEIFRGILGNSKTQGPKHNVDQYVFHMGRSKIIAVPIGNGEKIRGLRANYVIADEFSSIPKEVFEVVIKGFGAVSANPVERVKSLSRADALREMGHEKQALDIEQNIGFGNQVVISGTAYYAFNHFYEYWQKYKRIVSSRGDEETLREIFLGDIPEGFDWRHYSVIRIPYKALPRGFMDDAQISQSRAMSHSATFNMEYNAQFAKDSEGFFRRSIIEKCVVGNTLIEKNGEPIDFSPTLVGQRNRRYVYGIDPASEADNFAIVVLELYEDYRRIVYAWTTTRQKMKEMMKNQGETTLQSFYSAMARKIRDLMHVFPTEHIAIDSQGGGIAVIEALHEAEIMRDGEEPIWEYIARKNDDPFWWEPYKKETDAEMGLHYIHKINFAKADVIAEANHGLRYDLERQNILFPRFDTVAVAEMMAKDKAEGKEYNTYEDCMMEIEELKDELTTIEHTQTNNGRDRWDTPEVKISGTKKGRMRKDRYSALIIANLVARNVDRVIGRPEYKTMGGYYKPDEAGAIRQEILDKPKTGVLYTGRNPNFAKQLSALNYGVVKR